MANRKTRDGPTLDGSLLCWATLDAFAFLRGQQPSRAAAIARSLQKWSYDTTERRVAGLLEELRTALGRDVPGTLAYTRFRDYYPVARDAESLSAVESRFEGRHRDAARRLWFLLRELPGKPHESTFGKPHPDAKESPMAKKKPVRQEVPKPASSETETPPVAPVATVPEKRTPVKDEPARSGVARTSRRGVDLEKAAAMFALQVGGLDAAIEALNQLKRKLGVE